MANFSLGKFKLKRPTLRILQRQRLKPIIAIEISTDFVKVLEIDNVKNVPTLGKLVIQKIANLERDKGGGSLAYKSSGLLSNQVVTYLPRHLVSVKIMEFPSVDPNEIQDMVSVQVSKQVPYTNEEVIWGYKILKTYESGYSEVMVAIPRYKVISERIKWLFESGFDVEGFSLSSECLYNWYCQNYLDPEARYNNTDMVVDISSDHTEFLVISQGRIVFSKAILLGANSIQAADGYDKWQEEFMADLRDTLEIYRSEGKRKEIDSIFLTGAQNIDSDKLQNRINKGLGIDVRREDALKNIKFLKGTTQLPEKELIRSTSITALVGAGIKTRSLDINFIPRAIKISKGLGQRKSDLTTIGILLMGIVTLITVLPGAKIYKRISYLNELKQEDIEMRKGVEEIERLRMKIRLVEERLGAGDSILNVIDELYRVTPKELYNKSLEIDEERNIVIKGRASAMSEIFNFITTLEESERIANVKTSFTATKEDKEGNYAEFEISCKYQALKD